MRLRPMYRKAALALVWVGSSVWSVAVPAVTINFSAILTDGTCTLSLDKSTLPLGSIALSQLRPAQLNAQQPFTLFVQDCTSGGSLTPQVTISGNGVTQDNKWLFRNAGSAAGVGIVVIRSDTAPDYSAPEVKDGTSIALANAGQIPANQALTFYAGASCGGSTGCASTGAGDVTASLMFTFAYQ